MTEPTQLVVSQEAREAAWPHRYQGAYGEDSKDAWMSGRYDRSDIVQAFQRAMNQSFLAGLEKAAEVAWSHYEDHPASTVRAVNYRHAGRRIAEAIRSLSIEEGGA